MSEILIFVIAIVIVYFLFDHKKEESNPMRDRKRDLIEKYRNEGKR